MAEHRGLHAVKGGAPSDNTGGASPPPQPPKLPDPPAWISQDARAFWDRLAPHVPDGHLHPGNVDMFAMLCTSLATYAEADQAVAAGVLIAAGQDLIPNPALSVRGIADQQVARWAKIFGLTPDAQPARPAKPGGMRHLREA